jgi:arylsulfatase A-like enzyme
VSAKASAERALALLFVPRLQREYGVRRIPLFSGAVIMLLLVLGCGSETAPRPNVLLVMLDTVRADHLSTYGYERETSPNLTQLAAAGVRFDHVVSTAPWTVPSHASLMTGQAPAVHGAHHESWVLSTDAVTLAERFQKGGWRTAGFSANPFVGRPTRLDQGFDHFQRIRSNGKDVSAGALDFIASGPEPWFVFLNYMEAHMPYMAVPSEAIRRYWPGEGTGLRQAVLQQQLAKFRYECGLEKPPPEELELLVAAYDGAIAHLDALLGELFDALQGHRARTLIVVLSDHGELLGEHGRIEHQFSLLEPLLRVPLILSLPGRIPAGQVIEAPISLADVHGMILRVAGLEAGAAPGDPLGLRNTPRGDLLAEYYRPGRVLRRFQAQAPECARRLDRRLTSVQRGALKLVWSSDGSRWLYDLEADPGEQRNLAAEHPDLVAELERAVDARQALARRSPASEVAPILDAEARDQLRNLGYLGDEDGT